LKSVVHIDKKFSGIERDKIREGLREWERATNGIVKFVIKNDWNSEDEIELPVPDENGTVKCTRDMYIVRALSTDAVVKGIEEEIESTIAGYANPTCRLKFVLIVADKIDNAEKYLAVTIHEMGHMLGLQHMAIPNETSMFPGLPKSTACVTELDLKQFCAIGWKCDPAELSPCKL
jgi:hypothetical protein